MSRVLHILLVEDNPGDVELMTLAFEEYGLNVDLSVAKDGLEALEHLRSGSTAPDIILLDLNLPKMNGMEFLDVIRQEQPTAQLPVIILTSSKANLDIQDSYKRHANCYIIKPSSMEMYVGVAKQVEAFWAQSTQEVAS